MSGFSQAKDVRLSLVDGFAREAVQRLGVVDAQVLVRVGRNQRLANVCVPSG
jgi:hypothetical protein